MAGFVFKEIHACNRSKASANDGNDKQGGFGDPEGTLLGLLLINAHHGKTYNIYDN